MSIQNCLIILISYLHVVVFFLSHEKFPVHDYSFQKFNVLIVPKESTRIFPLQVHNFFLFFNSLILIPAFISFFFFSLLLLLSVSFFSGPF